MNEITLDEFKKRLKSFANDIYTIPNNFYVNEDYLQGLSKDCFINAFIDYRNIIVDMYQDAAINTFKYGFTSINKKTNEEKLYDEFKSALTYREKLIQIQHFFNRICDSSILVKDSLEVNATQLRKYIKTFPKIKNPNLLINRMIENGFVFTGYSGKLNTTMDFCITHSKNKHLVNVIKRFSESKYSKLGMEYDYAHLNYKLLSLKKTENIPLTDLFVYNSLSDKTQNFLIDFNTSMNNSGYYYGECPTSGFCWGISQFAYSKNPENKKDYVCRLYQRKDSLVVRLFLNNVNSYSNYIENCPDFIKDSFINDFGNCNYCKDNCSKRKTYSIHNIEYNKCNGITFEFYNLDLESIPYYIQLINLSAKSKKK